MENDNNKIAIIVAPNGARKTRQDHPALPITVDQIVTEVIACRDAGAAMVHLHARDSNGKHSLAIDDNIQVMNAVTAAVGDSIIVQLTTEAIGMYTPKQQMELIRHTQPEAASFGLKELIPNDAHLDKAKPFFQWVADVGMIAQYILYSVDDIALYFSLLKSGVLPNKNHHTLLVLGRYHKTLQSSPRDLVPFLTDKLLDNSHRWAVCAFGVQEQKCLITAMLLGADVRVGFENNHLNNLGLIAKNNASQVDNIKELTDLLGINRHNAHSYRSALTD
ncbi:3-keto-5-aminohexanoate cleavage protein [Vibrio sp. DW001]|uniref:3-keto-5-aminohexanoate cleavage protein n=1 Tax=Vibrio sp. DW001 TaxID=2912315 RepID=UPI0023B1D085|nr:3-keto-5-aminohexanoate cleavage protein [Vibrio sp. DW001]WED28039.1 3-keto-5-aminohexanoate cleavage protein [Vibrio sp. DW001]